MKAEDSRKVFTSVLRAEGLTQKALELEKAVELMLAFYKSSSIENLREGKDSDGVAFYYQIANRRGPTSFEVGFIRTFRLKDAENAGSRLRLTFNYPWFETVHKTGLFDKLKPVAPEGNKFCWDAGSASELDQYIRNHAVYLTVKDIKPKSVNLVYEDVWGVLW